MKKGKKKILYVITKSNWGGAQRYVYDLATHLPEGKFEAVVAAGGNGPLLQKLNDSNVRTISVPTLERDIGFLKEFRALRTLLKIIKDERPDILHLNSPKAAGLGALVGRIGHVRCIIQTVHGWSFNENRSLIWRTLTWLFSWVTALLSHKNIVVAKHDLRQAQKMPFIKERTTCIHTAISEQKLLDREAARKFISETKKIPKGKSAIWIGTIGELHKNKGLTYGIEAIKSLLVHNQHLYWIVIGSGEEKRNLQRIIEKEKLQKHIFFLGYLDNAAEYMQAFDIFMLPSVKEGLPYVLLEAHAAGLPIVASDVGGIPEIVRDKTGIVVPPRNTEKIADAIELLLSHPITVATKKDEFETMLQKTIALY